MKDWLVQSQLTNKSETHVSCSPTVTWKFQSKTFHYFNPQVHSIYSQSYTQATSNKSQFLTLSILWTARQSASFFPCLCLDSDWWLDGDGLVSHRHRPVCMLLGSVPTALSATGGAILHMYGTWSNGTNLFFVNIEVDTLFGMLNILPSLERT